jgi:hypothetical protein
VGHAVRRPGLEEDLDLLQIFALLQEADGIVFTSKKTRVYF